MKQKPPKGTYPNNLASAMKSRSKLMDSVAFKSSLSRPVFMSLYNEQRPMTKTYAHKLARAIECTPEELFAPERRKQQELVSSSAVVATPIENQTFGNVLLLTESENALVQELLEREINFLTSTGRNLQALVYSNIVLRLTPSPVVEQTLAESPANAIKTPNLTPVRTKVRASVVKKLSRPWSVDELADALSALRSGMSNEDVAGATNRPLADVTTTKVIFGWMWHSKQPTNPSKAVVLEKLNSQSKAAWRQLVAA